MATYKSEYYRFSGSVWDLYYFKTTIDQVDGLQTALNNRIVYDDVLMPTNTFGGKKLYINSIDNAMYAADKRFMVTATRHLKVVNSENYPKLNPDYVAAYTFTGSGNVYTITNNPIPNDIVVYVNDTLCSQVTTPTNGTQFNYNTSTGVITFGATPSGTVYVHPGPTITQYLDSPVTSTLTAGAVANLFDGSYETSQGPGSADHYMKVRISASADGRTMFQAFNTYSHGTFYLSYYYAGTPEKAEYRVYNYGFRPHGIGWKKTDFTNYIGDNNSTAYVQAVSDGINHGRSIMEFIIYGKTPNPSFGSYQTGLTQIDWKLSRPDLSKTGSTVTKYGVNKLFYELQFGDRTTNKVVISPLGSIKINDKDVYYPDNPPSLVSVYRSYISDFNAAFTPGVYYFDSSTINGANTSVWGWARIEVNNNISYNSTNNWLLQRVQQTDGKEYYRYKINNYAWGSWQQVYSSQYKPTPADIGAPTLTDTNQKLEMGGTTQYIRLAYGPITRGYIKHSGGLEYEMYHSGNFNPASYLPLVGGTLTGNIAGTNAAFTGNLGAAAVFTSIINSDSGSIGLSETLNFFDINNIQVRNVPTPSAGHHAANKDYVDNFAAPVATKTASATLALSDRNQFVYVNGTANTIMTIPANQSVAFPIGTEIHFVRYSSHEVSIAPASGVTLQSEGSKRRINAQYQVVTIKKILSDTWVLFGALKT